MANIDGDTILDLIDRIGTVTQLLGIHEEQAVQLNNAVVHYHTHQNGRDSDTAELIASADVNGARMAALGKTANSQLVIIETELYSILKDKEGEQDGLLHKSATN
jgi:hypothetical protein